MACSLAESFLARILFRIDGKDKGEGSSLVLLLDDRIARAPDRAALRASVLPP
jgi:hypothetical protein